MDPNNNSRPTIERATQDDIDAVADLWVRLARDQREYESFVRAADNRETMRETLAAHQVNDGLLVARLGDSIVGFASFTIERGSLELDATRGLLSNLYVDPAYRDHGLGTALLEAAEETLTERGAAVMVLEVMAANEAARRFYERQGYDTYRVGMKRSLENDASSKNDTHSKEDG
ncbi:GNAT family N-acetyltransferase [Natronorubrum sp. JWXQ-INN-674]|uniref:GNAT family N-acetyltransferase n=1 Tax=Natronorubrum halalkaliphilum TaxID=2691917 RepID=A0A6B0VM97_9EURY|nr:GNAT family N-acetyltransferase [Natronorubrum halalkaliphilum]MXV62285.1 GNAT family N-acetyltransferase [Natronorubrum halalkaliphilum]